MASETNITIDPSGLILAHSVNRIHSRTLSRTVNRYLFTATADIVTRSHHNRIRPDSPKHNLHK
ncbi:hypothetical protein BofuT4_uP162790.1 [Botrytis cinerea T4]|uniref:Uncharacterized protein n=1 Tax=Botryotinia fuckeliana (strain T4) TaxID=999810 RepID=G2YT86_BOTF4|nr:hypothetical protein BofuT4_uP162790.1 [Botrytis cinerea T4]